MGFVLPGNLPVNFLIHFWIFWEGDYLRATRLEYRLGSVLASVTGLSCCCWEWEQTEDASHEFIGEWKWWEKQRMSISEWITCFAFCFCISIFLFSFFLFSTAKDILTCGIVLHHVKKDGTGLTGPPKQLKTILFVIQFFLSAKLLPFFIFLDFICSFFFFFCQLAIH